jgi:hypothetical protein
MTKGIVKRIFRFRKPTANERFERFRHHHSLLFAAFVLGITTLVVLNTVFIVRIIAYGTPHQQVTIYPSSTTSLQMADNGSIQAQVRNVAMHEKDQVFPIDSTQKILVMDITIKNKTKKRQHFIPVNHLYVRSEEGTYSALHISSYATAPIPAREIDPEETLSGQITFVVPSTVATSLLYVDTGWDKSVPLVIDVLH